MVDQDKLAAALDKDDAARDTSTTVMPPSNQIREAWDHWESMLDKNNQLEETIKVQEKALMELSTRYDALKKWHSKVISERDKYQRFAIALSTRLTTVKESILSAEAESLKHVANGDSPEPEEPEEIADPKAVT
jgi:hypothetical protein